MPALGRSGVEVSPVILGVMGFAAPSRADRVACIRAALSVGITTLDTAPLYGLGESERAVGEAIRGHRHEVCLVTKVGLRWDGEHGDVLLRTAEGALVRRDSRPGSVRRDVDESLQRLGVDTLDVVLVHHPDPHTPLHDTMGELVRLRDEGKLRAIGVSNFDAAGVRAAQAALGDVPLAAHQGRYSLVHRELEADLLPTLRAEQIGFLAYSPLAQGLLAGGRGRLPRPVLDWRRHEPAFALENRRRIEAAIDLGLHPVARRHGVPVPTMALSWVLSRPGVTAVVAGARTVEQVRDLARAADVRPSARDRVDLEAAFEALRIDPRPRRHRRERVVDLALRVGDVAKRRVRRLRAITRGVVGRPAARD